MTKRIKKTVRLRRSPSYRLLPPTSAGGLWGWLAAHLTEAVFFFFLAALGGVWIYLARSGPQPPQSAEGIWASVVTPEFQNRLEARYPSGYQLFTIEGVRLVPVGPATFKQKVSINWDLSQLTLKSEEKWRINIFNVRVPAAGFSQSLSVDLPIKEQHIFVTNAIKNVRLTVEVLNRTEEQMLCLLGLEVQ